MEKKESVRKKKKKIKNVSKLSVKVDLLPIEMGKSYKRSRFGGDCSLNMPNRYPIFNECMS